MIHKLKKTFFIFTFLFSISFFSQKKQFNAEVEQKNVIQMLDNFNKAAADAEFKSYFSFFLKDSYFIGTDATERWSKKGFMIWAEPYFKMKKTWNFTSIERNITFSEDGKLAWFDELLDTQMKICRGSGVLEKTSEGWKIRQYVLSMTVPNAISSEVTKLKAPIEDELLQTLKNKNSK